MAWTALKTPSVAVLTIAVALVLGLAAVPASAAKPSSAGNGKDKNAESRDQHDEDDKHGKANKHKTKHAKSKKSKHRKHGKHFRDQDQSAVRAYYDKELRHGKGCPPGLAKNGKGCMPPGQAKKQWSRGESLPGDVERHELPRKLLDALPLPPAGQRYVRVATDILLVGTDTGVVIDAIVDALIP